jgi:murein hydrolase activator
MAAKPSLFSACLPVITGLVFISFFLTSGFAKAVGRKELDQDIQDRNRQISQLINERTSTQDLLNELKSREWGVVDVLKALNTNIQTNQEQLNFTILAIENLEEEILLTRNKIGGLREQIAEDKTHLHKQIHALFYMRKIRKMTLFLNVDSFQTYFRNHHLLQKNSEIDAITLARLEGNLVELEQEIQLQKDQKTKLRGLRTKREQQAELLEFEKQQQFAYLHHIRQDRSLRVKYLGLIQVELEKLNDALHTLAVRKENERRSQQFRGLYKYKYSLPSPVTGKPVHRFGQKNSRYYTLFKRGVLVETQEDLQVRSILQGKVVWSGPFHGYRNLIILDHGKGSFSVYGNLDELFVLVDDVIDQSSVLGNVAYNEAEQRYLFYFETRYNKRAVNPEQWLKKPIWNQKK